MEIEIMLEGIKEMIDVYISHKKNGENILTKFNDDKKLIEISILENIVQINFTGNNNLLYTTTKEYIKPLLS